VGQGNQFNRADAMHIKIVSDTEQAFNGKHYYLHTGERYFSKGVSGGGCKRLHQVVYEHFNGKIPDGYHVHHKDHNPVNNDIDNLGVMPASEHLSLHAIEYHRENPEAGRRQIEKNQDKCRAWHASEAGHEWHKQHYEANKHNLYKINDFKCDNCGKESTHKVSGHVNNFCTNACKSAFRRKSGVDNVQAGCAYCSAEFTSNKYTKTLHCSKGCAARTRANILRDSAN
jgi:hypothetical protein